MTRTFSTYQLVHLMKLLANRHKCLLITDGVGVGKTISGGYILFINPIVRRQFDRMPTCIGREMDK